MVNVFVRSIWSLCIAGCILAGTALPAQSDPLSSGWALDAGASKVTFESLSSSGTPETHAFHAYRGVIDRSGAAVMKLRLASVDTQNDMRDVRLRFLFFETFKFPEATIHTQISRENLFALEENRQSEMTLPITLDLHGETKDLSAKVLVSVGEENAVSVVSAAPVVIRAKDFGLMEGLSRLQDAYYGDIQQEFPVSFKFVFRPYETDLPVLASANEMTPEICENRLSEAATTGRVSFQKGSHEVAESSRPMLEKVADIVNECEGMTITVEGHTDSVGAESSNKALSERRADSVAKYLVKMGLSENRVNAEGRGETTPIAPNDTADNRAKNRRIEFHADHRGGLNQSGTASEAHRL